MNKVTSLIILLPCLLLTLSSCGNNYCDEIVQYSKQKLGNDFKVGEIELKKVYNFDWDTLYIFGAFDHPSEISKKIGFNCKCDIVPDHKELFLFTLNNKIVKQKVTECLNVNFTGKSNRKNVYKIRSSNSKFIIKRDENEYFTLIPYGLLQTY